MFSVVCVSVMISSESGVTGTSLKIYSSALVVCSITLQRGSHLFSAEELA